MSSSKSGCLLESRRRDGSPNLRQCKIGGIVCSASGLRNARGWSPTGLQGDEVPAPKDSRRWGRQGVSGGGFFWWLAFSGLGLSGGLPLPRGRLLRALECKRRPPELELRYSNRIGGQSG